MTWRSVSVIDTLCVSVNLTFDLFFVDKCADFITTFEDPRLNQDSLHGKLKYMRLLVSENLTSND